MSTEPKPQLDNNFSFQAYVEYFYENSFWRWGINEEGIPQKEADARAEASKYPTQESIDAEILADFQAKFPPTTSVDDFVEYMKRAGAECVRTGPGIWSDELQTVVRPSTGPAKCWHTMAVPLPYSQKTFDPEKLEHIQGGDFSSPENFLKWQEEYRSSVSWTLKTTGYPNVRNKVGAFRFYIDWVTI